ncbi:hypothetical protein Glove_152g48 [Diversispora epigaea]|uniref:Uncharacterized protein n=1 Tax=Diversispora epigaea TaxID=1348612 RepID=A0A397IZ53_9GLOM|nr:hypothetical protein Glove_152g48 [Diversispora epigaea]
MDEMDLDPPNASENTELIQPIIKFNKILDEFRKNIIEAKEQANLINAKDQADFNECNHQVVVNYYKQLIQWFVESEQRMENLRKQIENDQHAEVVEYYQLVKIREILSNAKQRLPVEQLQEFDQLVREINNFIDVTNQKVNHFQNNLDQHQKQYLNKQKEQYLNKQKEQYLNKQKEQVIKTIFSYANQIVDKFQSNVSSLLNEEQGNNDTIIARYTQLVEWGNDDAIITRYTQLAERLKGFVEDINAKEQVVQFNNSLPIEGQNDHLETIELDSDISYTNQNVNNIQCKVNNGLNKGKENDEQMIKLWDKVQDLHVKNKNLETELKSKDQIIQNLMNAHASLRAEAAKCQSALGEATNKRKENDKQMIKLRDKVQDLHVKNKNLETELKSRDQIIQNLMNAHASLRAEAAKYQSALGEATTFRLDDHDHNDAGRLANDIKDLKHQLENFCTLKKTKIEDMKVKRLLSEYHCFTEKPNKNLIKGVLQRCIIEMIIKKVDKHFKTDEENKQSLETKLVSTTDKILEYMKSFSTHRVGVDEITKAAPIKLRQLVYAVLGNRGFSKENDESENQFIMQLRNEVVTEIDQYREVIDTVKKNKIESEAIEIIRKIIMIFFFRFNIQEPAVEYKWFENSEKFDTEFMEGSWDNNELDETVVNICSFPLIGTNLNDEEKYKVITQASVVKTNANY